MPLPDEAVVREVLSRRGRGTALYEAALGGWEDYKSSPEAGRWRRKGTRAAIVWERMIDRALDAFLDDDGVVSIEKDDSILFLADDMVLFRMKKGNSKRMTSNYPTPAALAFHDHDEELPGVLPHRHRVEVAYILNSRETQIESVCIVARDQFGVLWSFELDNGVAVPLPLPLIPTAPRPTSGLARLREDRTGDKTHEGES